MSTTQWQIRWFDPNANTLRQTIERGALDPSEWLARLAHDRHLTDRTIAPPLFIKRYPPGKLVKRLRAALGYSAATRAARNSQDLLAQAFPTARALLVVRHGKRDEELLVSEALDGPDFATLWQGAAPAERVSYLCQAAKLLSSLHQKGLQHGDTKWQNFALHDGSLRLVDLDSLRPHRSLRRCITRDIARFVLSAEAAQCPREALQAFLEAYAQALNLSPQQIIDGALPRLQLLRARHKKRYGHCYPRLLS